MTEVAVLTPDPADPSYAGQWPGVLDRLSEALSTEVDRFGITVVTVQPGEFNTNIATARLRPEVISEAHRPGYEKAMAVLGGSMHYSRDPDELARVVARIIASPKPAAVYRVAQGVQKMSVLLKKMLPGRVFEVKDDECVACNLCVDVCPVQDCITMRELPLGEVDLRTGQKVAGFGNWTTHPNNPMAKAAE